MGRDLGPGTGNELLAPWSHFCRRFGSVRLCVVVGGNIRVHSVGRLQLLLELASDDVGNLAGWSSSPCRLLMVRAGILRLP